MAVTFVIGRAGSGKTHRCLSAIIAELKKDPLGPPIYWLLPRQATFQAERQLTCESGLPGFCRARILSFDKLGREILADAGGGAIPEITDEGRRIIIGFLLRRNQSKLRYFASVAHQTGLAGKLDATFAEFERCGKDATQIELLVKDFGCKGEEECLTLLDKVHDLHLIYQAYNAYLGQDRLDQHRRLLQVLKAIDECRLFPESTIYIDGFQEFTEYERHVIARLGKICRHVEITFLMDERSPVLRQPDLLPQELSLFHQVERTFRRLWFTLKEQSTPIDSPPVVLRAPSRFKSAGLTAIERHLFAMTRPPIAPGDGVDLVQAPDRRSEVDAAARHILDLLSKGLKLRDIAVLTRDLEPYHELIGASFREHGIAHYVDHRRPAAHHPLLQFLRALLAIGSGAWPHEWMMTLLKCGLAGIESRDADELENYVLRHRIRGVEWENPEPWNYRRTMTRRSEEGETVASAETARIDANRKQIVERLRPFIQLARGPEVTVRALVTGIFAVFKRFEVARTLSAWIDAATAANQIEQRGEHEQVWAEIVKLFESLVDLLGTERIKVQGFADVLETALEGFDLALAPAAVDQVLVGQADRTRIGPTRAVLLLGLNEGAFPKTPREDSVLSDAERRELRQRRLEVDAGAERRLLDESLLGYIAFTRASERLYVSQSQSDAGGKALRPSQFWERLRRILPKVEVRTVPRDGRDEPRCIGTPRQLVTSLIRWVRQGTHEGSPAAPPRDRGRAASIAPEPPRPAAEPLGSLSATWGSLYQWFATRPPSGDAVDQMRGNAWTALAYTNTAALAPDVAAQLFPTPLNATVGRIETFAACHFKHYLRYGLDLQAREEEDVSMMDMGSVFHHVLERLVRDMISRRKEWADYTPKQLEQMIRTHAQEIGKTLRGEILMSSARSRYLLQRIQRTLGQVVAAQASASKHGNFRPAYTRLDFGEGARLPAYAIPTPAGREVRLHGVIDRVDLLPGGNGEQACSVIDYRMGSNRLALDQAFHGLALQLLTYLLVLEASGEQLTGKPLSPVAAFYVQTIRRLGEVGHPDDAIQPDDPCFDLTVKPRGILEQTYLKQFDNALTPSSTSQVIAARINKDGTFGSKDRSDLADAAEFRSLLDHVRKQIARLADGIMEGDVGIAPFWMNQRTPCPECEFRSVCRFETTVNKYHPLRVMGREQVLMELADDAR